MLIAWSSINLAVWQRTRGSSHALGLRLARIIARDASMGWKLRKLLVGTRCRDVCIPVGMVSNPSLRNDWPRLVLIPMCWHDCRRCDVR